MSATVEDLKAAWLVIRTVQERTASNTPPTTDNVELCEWYVLKLADIGLNAASLALEDALNDWCGLLL
ncbi:hypothetical protein [Pseudoalteromonas sp. 68 DY56-GL68]|uniref:hypothetical protein n=1 Tax=Pseudoalteromonas sp. 68 DY56-GL68 TaxID=2974919 RepID=UPI00352B1FF8